jgi:hypothetical protein
MFVLSLSVLMHIRQVIAREQPVKDGDPFAEARRQGVNGIFIEANPQVVPGASVVESGRRMPVGPNWKPGYWMEEPIVVRSFLAPLSARVTTSQSSCSYDYNLYFAKDGVVVEQIFVNLSCSRWEGGKGPDFVLGKALRKRLEPWLARLSWRPSWRLAVEFPDSTAVATARAAVAAAGAPFLEFTGWVGHWTRTLAVRPEWMDGECGKHSGEGIESEKGCVVEKMGRVVKEAGFSEDCQIGERAAWREGIGDDRAIQVLLDCGGQREVDLLCEKLPARIASCQRESSLLETAFFLISRVRPTTTVLQMLTEKIGHASTVHFVPLVPPEDGADEREP